MVTIGALAFGAAACGPAGGGTNPPPDVATITSVDVPSNQIQPGKPFVFEADATDPGSNNYNVDFEPTTDTNWQSTDLYAEIRIGRRYNSPSPDTPACEYDEDTTATPLTTHTEAWFVWNGPVGSTFDIKVCAGSFNDQSLPWNGGSCHTETFTAVGS